MKPLKFLSVLDASTRDVMVSTAKAGDESLDVNGATIMKSAVGDATFQILKSQQAEIAVQKEAATVAVFTDLAKSADFATLPGELTVKATALRAIDGLPEVAKTAVTAMLKAGNEAMKARHAPAAAHVDWTECLHRTNWTVWLKRMLLKTRLLSNRLPLKLWKPLKVLNCTN